MCTESSKGKKKSCSFALCFRNDSLPLVGTFHSECVMLVSLLLLLLLLHPPPSPHSHCCCSVCDICSLCCRAALWFLWQLLEPLDPWTGRERRKKNAQSGQIQVQDVHCPLVRGLECFGRGAPMGGSCQGIPGSLPSFSWEKNLQASSEVKGVKSSRFWVWLNFTFPFVLFRSAVGSHPSSASAFKMVKMQMPDLRYCN